MIGKIQFFLLLIFFISCSNAFNPTVAYVEARSKFQHFLSKTNLFPMKEVEPVVVEEPLPAPLTRKNAFERPITLPPHRLSIHQFIYVVLTSTFITCLIIADVIGVKIFEIPLPFEIFGYKSIEHTCGMITFPVTFLLGDVINEYYGARATKQTVYIGLIMSILVFIVMNIAQVLPFLDKPFNVTPFAFDSIFGSAKLMYVASVSAYFVGQLADIWLFGVLKKLTRGKYLWLRATGSTIVSQLLDSFVVSYIAFSFGKTLTGQTPATMPEVYKIAITGYTLKFVIAGFLTPFLYLIRSVLHKKYGFEPLPADYCESSCSPPPSPPIKQNTLNKTTTNPIPTKK